MEDTYLESWPEEELEQLESCPVCGSEQYETLYEEVIDKVFGCAPGWWTVQRCNRCRSAFLNPRPTATSMHIAYRNYHTHSDPQRNSTEAMGTTRQWLRALANGYRNQRYGTNLQPATRLGIVLGWASPHLRRTVRAEFRDLPASGAGKRILDVGFGNGTFLERVRDAGWQVAGADPDEEVVRRAIQKGLPVRQGGVEAWSDEPESFDYITLSHVIEHVHDPRSALEEVYRLLKPGGRVWLETPNIDSFGHRRFGEAWRGLEVPRHLVLFNWDALQRLLLESGFTSLKNMPVRGNYSNNALKSLAIQRNQDPYGELGPFPWTEWPYIYLVKMWLMISPKRSEFLTITARKAE